MAQSKAKRLVTSSATELYNPQSLSLSQGSRSRFDRLTDVTYEVVPIFVRSIDFKWFSLLIHYSYETP